MSCFIRLTFLGQIGEEGTLYYRDINIDAVSERWEAPGGGTTLVYPSDTTGGRPRTLTVREPINRINQLEAEARAYMEIEKERIKSAIQDQGFKGFGG